MKTLLLTVALVIATSLQAEDFDHSAYQTAQLSDAVASLRIDPHINYFFDAAHPKYHTTATFTGGTRPINADVRKYIEAWVKTMGHPSAYSKMFNTEVEIKQGSMSYWMPIQDSLIEPWTEEMTANSTAEIYVLLMGAYNHVPVFAISSFSSIRGELTLQVQHPRLLEPLDWCLIAMAFSRPLVEFHCHPIAVGLSDARQASALREVLAE